MLRDAKYVPVVPPDQFLERRNVALASCPYKDCFVVRWLAYS
jgi:hypothetical protein